MPATPGVHRCFHCGYDLRGSPTHVCPECGKTKPLSIEIQDPLKYHPARALLEHHGLLLHADQPGGVLGLVGAIDGISRSAWLWIDANDAERVDELLDGIGINANIDVKPIVDRSEPICPKCEAPLDPLGRSQCEKCGTEFRWVEIESSNIDPTGLECRSCGYELTGLTVDRCPECNCEIADVERLAQAALGKVERPSQVEQTIRSKWFFTVVLFFLAGAFVIAALNADPEDSATRSAYVVFAVTLITAALLLSVLRLIGK